MTDHVSQRELINSHHQILSLILRLLRFRMFLAGILVIKVWIPAKKPT